jgi:homoserine kinase
MTTRPGAPMFRAAALRVRVPATSANLGPGFDSFGLALSLADEVIVRVAEQGLDVDVAGEGADTVRRDHRNLVVKAMFAAFDRMGGRPRGLEVRCLNRIPHGRGLGSSAAAVVAGAWTARALTVGGDERLDDDALLALVTRLEGHPDNVAAALGGGFSVAWTEDDGCPRSVSLAPSLDIVPVVFVPATQVRTVKARTVLPASVPHGDAVRNTARAALLVEALTRRPELLLAATADALHQEYRRDVMPRTLRLVDELRAEGLPAVVSGAGPTVLVLCTPDQADGVAAREVRGFTAQRLAVDVEGTRAVPLAATA